MELGSRVYPLSRYWYSGEFRFYYAYGNTPAQDFLQNCSGMKEPAVLVLGCGDIRSCFYSIWKNFDSKSCPRFDGVHFVLNDISAAVLARNVLFLYLCLQMPEEEHDLKKWLSGMWAIWYCHELYPDHDQLLHDSLDALCRYAGDWSKNDNPLHSIVKFTSSATLSEISKVWKMWLEHKININSVHDMQAVREANLKLYKSCGKLPQSDSGASSFVEDCTEIPFEVVNNKKCDVQKYEVLAYVSQGSVYAEEVLGVNISSAQTLVNFTLFEREDGRYSLHYCSLPYRCYHQTVDFSSKSFVDTIFLIDDKHFETTPLLANSVQQFLLWLQSAHKILNSNYKLSFTFDCSHALTFCFELEYGKNSSSAKQRFDLVYTSNLMDHLGPPNLILSAIPLLNENGRLFTTTLFKDHFKTLDCYINASFGLDSKLFPILFGFRCINHEGENYTSPVTAEPCPIMFNNCQFVYHENLLIWEKIRFDTIPLVFSSGQELPITLALSLLDSVQVFVYPLIKTPDLPQMMDNLCVETAVKVFQVFMSNSCADFSPQFWKPLADAMEMTLKPYLYSMQTQLLLHGIHMHLTVTEKDCPMCLEVPICNSIGFFSAKTFFLEELASPKFMALVHKRRSNRAEILCDCARRGEDVHIFDCVAYGGSSCLHLCFYGPLHLVQEGYSVTIVASCMSPLLGNFQCNVEDLPTIPLGSLLSLFETFIFFQATAPDPEKCVLPSFGMIMSHDSNGDSSAIEIDLAFDVISANKLQLNRMSPNTVQLSFGEHQCQLECPYPIAYGDIKVTVRKKDKKISMLCPRAPQECFDEQPLFIINPDRDFFLFPFTLSDGAMNSLVSQQFTMRDHEVLDHQNSQLHSLVRVKRSLSLLFQRNEDFYLILDSIRDEVMCLVLVNNRLFNYENRTPVIDLAFCFLEKSFANDVLSGWESIALKVCNIHLNVTDHGTLKKVLHHFSRRTIGTCSTICNTRDRLNQLTQKKIQQYFTRAVITLLLCDVDKYSQPILDQFTKVTKCTPTSEKCENCSKNVADPKQCSKCKKAKYCGKECQREHWKVHKLVCVMTDSAEVLKEQEPTFRPFPLARYWYSGDFRFYYAFGNTAAEDILQNCSGVKQPMILSLGCGDIRSCFYTLWKHFGHSISEAPWKFDKVHFVLNDCSSPVQARNILFILLCLQLPQNIKDRKKWLCGMWAIWYCHELYPQHQKMLDDSLTVLLKYSSSFGHWESAGNPLGQIVQFATPNALDAISQTWRMWLDRTVNVPSVQHMHLSRCMELKNRGVNDSLEVYAISYSSSITFVNGEHVAIDKARKEEVIAYTKSGNCYAENVLELELEAAQTSVNLTLYERSDGVYSLHYGSIPFSGYYHTVEFPLTP